MNFEEKVVALDNLDLKSAPEVSRKKFCYCFWTENNTPLLDKVKAIIVILAIVQKLLVWLCYLFPFVIAAVICYYCFLAILEAKDWIVRF